jgi:hypothetical protein
VRSLFIWACLLPSGALGQSQEELVYTGRPIVRATGDAFAVRQEQIAPDEAAKYTLRIVRRGSRYLWASREDRELTPSFAGRYITFTSDAGFIRVVNPLFDEARHPLRDSDAGERFDYMEVMYLHLGVVIYWGRGTGAGVAPGK